MAGHSLDRQEVPGDNVIARNAHITEVAHPLYGRYLRQNQQFTLDSQLPTFTRILWYFGLFLGDEGET